MAYEQDALRLGTMLAVLAAMGAVETLRPRRPWEDSRGLRWLVHGWVAVFNAAVLRLTAGGALYGFAALVRERGWGLAPRLGLDGALEIAATVVLFDLFDYGWHRINHTMPLLWRFHRVHHMDTHVDVTTALRFHAGELVLSSGMKGAWVLLWGPSAWALAAFEAATTAYALFHHSDIDFEEPFERALRWVHVTPRVHAAHHTVGLRSRDANYSAIFLVWDRLFGTFAEPDEHEMTSLGLADGRLEHLDFGAMLRAPFRR